MPMQNIIASGTDAATSGWFDLEPGQLTTVLMRTPEESRLPYGDECVVLEVRDAEGDAVAVEMLGGGRPRIRQLMGPGEYRVRRPASERPVAVDRI